MRQVFGSLRAPILALVLFPAISWAGPNLILNPGFEEGQGNYPGVGKFWETNDAQPHGDIDHLVNNTKHSGTWSQYLMRSDVWDLGMVRQVSAYNSVAAGRTYRISAWIKTANVTNPAGWYVFGVWWFNNDAALPGDSKMPHNSGDPLNYDWKEISWTAVAPPGANRIAALLTRHTNGDAWYDDVSITDITDGAPQIIRSPASFTRIVTKGQNLPNDTFTIQNGGGQTLNYTISDDAGWLSTSRTSGSSFGEIDGVDILYSTAALPVGDHSATITLSDPNATNSPQTVTVIVTVPVPGDFDNDQDVDQEDFGRFQLCITGPGASQNDPACAKARLDVDVDVDNDDFGIFQGCMTGAGVPGDPGCAG